MTVRLARAEDLPRIAAIEISAGERFRGTHMDWAADAEPTPLAELEPAQAKGELWVAEDSGELAGFLFAHALDDALYIHEVSVALGHQGKGYGRALIEAAADHARASGWAALTLTTDRVIAWNRPLYEHLGFKVLDDGEMTLGLFDRLDHERRLFPTSAQRCAMRRPL
ncbi:GNAT family N-acetyltransferase [Sphingoaurantiacus capsulatus]|uniref:GNAT family N-acetyltransferase n=1 Tax=Sphingoaurantiacus capsulatus TaxID=1771310 RepID=A0ABV7XE82_9SPHN